MVSITVVEEKKSKQMLSDPVEYLVSQGIPRDVAMKMVTKARQKGIPADFEIPGRVQTISESMWNKYFSQIKEAFNEVITELKSLPSIDERRRWLLENARFGSTKKTILATWRIPAMITCPGATELCRLACYALKGFYMLSPALAKEMVINLLASLLPEFPDYMVPKIERAVRESIKNIARAYRELGKPVPQKLDLIARLHDSGDFYSISHLIAWLRKLGVDVNELSKLLGIDIAKLPEDWYVRQWIKIAKKLPHIKFYTYTRSWRIPELVPALIEFASLPNTTLYLSVDKAMPPHEIEKAINLAKRYGMKIAYTGMTPLTPAILCKYEKEKILKVAKPTPCAVCKICAYGSADVVFPIH